MIDSLNNKELVAVGHDFAKALSCDTPIIEIAKMMSRLAERLDCTTAALRETTKQRDALASLAGMEAEPGRNPVLVYTFDLACDCLECQSLMGDSDC